MDAYSIHLQLNYLPVIGVPVGVILLVFGIWRKNDSLTKAGLWIFAALAVLILPVYVTGEITGANYPIVAAKELIGKHRSYALPGFVLIEVAGIASLFAVFFKTRRPGIGRRLVWLVLALTLLASVALVLAGLVGRQIKFATAQSGIEKAVGKNSTDMGDKLWLA